MPILMAFLHFQAMLGVAFIGHRVWWGLYTIREKTSCTLTLEEKNAWDCLSRLQSSTRYGRNLRKRLLHILLGNLVWTPDPMSSKQKDAWYCICWLQNLTWCVHNSRKKPDMLLYRLALPFAFSHIVLLHNTYLICESRLCISHVLWFLW